MLFGYFIPGWSKNEKVCLNSYLGSGRKVVRTKVGRGVEGAAATARRDVGRRCSKQGTEGGAGRPEPGKSPGWDGR